MCRHIEHIFSSVTSYFFRSPSSPQWQYLTLLSHSISPSLDTPAVTHTQTTAHTPKILLTCMWAPTLRAQEHTQGLKKKTPDRKYTGSLAVGPLFLVSVSSWHDFIIMSTYIFI